jgi:hypothetical protein
VPLAFPSFHFSGVRQARQKLNGPLKLANRWPTPNTALAVETEQLSFDDQ